MGSYGADSGSDGLEALLVRSDILCIGVLVSLAVNIRAWSERLGDKLRVSHVFYLGSRRLRKHVEFPVFNLFCGWVMYRRMLVIVESISHFEALGIPFSLKGIFRPSGHDYLLVWNLMHINWFNSDRVPFGT